MITGLLARVLMGTAVWASAAGLPWVWCLALAGMATMLYVAIKFEHGVGHRLVLALQNVNAFGLLVLAYGLQLALVSALYGIGRLFL